MPTSERGLGSRFVFGHLGQGESWRITRRAQITAGSCCWAPGGAAVTRSKDQWKSSDYGGKLLLGALEWDGAAVTWSKDHSKSSDRGRKLLPGRLKWNGAAATQSKDKGW